MPRLKQNQLFGGNTVKEAASIFKTIIEGEGTEAQNSVLFANAGTAIRTINPLKSIEQCIDEAKNSLMSGSAVKILEALIEE